MQAGLIGNIDKAITLAPPIGLGLMFVGLGVGLVELYSAINQGMTSAASISLVGKRPDEGGRAILLPALVETYAVVALLIGILMIDQEIPHHGNHSSGNAPFRGTFP